MNRTEEVLAEKVQELLNLAENLRDNRELTEAGMDRTLDTVQLLRMIEATAASANAQAVQEARNQRATWAEVGKMLGTSSQAAQQRYTRAQEVKAGDGLDDLHDAALPDDAPGAWIRQAIEKKREGEQ
jgi:hypothetical protein